MTFLSRVWLNPLRKDAQRLLRNPQSMHAATLHAISIQPVTERVLWRLELHDPHRAQVLVLSRSMPSWDHLIEQAGWPHAEEGQARVASYKPLLDGLARGSEYAFRLRANPVASTRRPEAPSMAQRSRLEAGSGRSRGARVPHRTVAHQLDWFFHRVEGWGFIPLTTQAGEPQVQLSGRERVSFHKRSSPGEPGRRVVLQAATYEGRVRVQDVEKARSALLDGVGKARAYGFGLLTLAPLRTEG